MYTSLNQYHVVLEVAPQFWLDPKGLYHIYVSNRPHAARAAFSSYQQTTTPLAVNHRDNFHPSPYRSI